MAALLRQQCRTLLYRPTPMSLLRPRLPLKTPSMPAWSLPSRRFASSSAPPSPATPKGLMQRYAALLEARPLTTKAATAAILGLVGDVVAQLVIEESKTGLEFKRVALFTSLQAGLIAPTLHFWYGYLSKLGGGAMGGVVKRLVLDQLGFAPVFIALMLSILLVAEGRADDVPDNLNDNWANAVLQNWKLWIPAQIINFAVIPPLYQVLFANGVGLIWNTYVSVVAHRKHTDAAPEDMQLNGYN